MPAILMGPLGHYKAVCKRTGGPGKDFVLWRALATSMRAPIDSPTPDPTF